MKISIRCKGVVPIRIYLPSALLTSDLGLRLFKQISSKDGKPSPTASMDDESLRRLLKAIRRWRREHGRLELVDVETADGDRIKVVI